MKYISFASLFLGLKDIAIIWNLTMISLFLYNFYFLIVNMAIRIKTTLWVLVLWIFLITLSWCWPKETKTITSIEDWQTKMMEISEKMMNGDISVEEWEKLLEEIWNNMESQTDVMKDLYNNVSEFKSLPKWAKNIWLYELKWFELIKDESVVVEYSKKNKTPESILLAYTYDDEGKAIKEIEKMASNIWLKESSFSPRIIQKQTDEMIGSMLELMSEEDRNEYEENKISWYISDWEIGDYYVMLSVQDGKISIIANNNAQMSDIME